MSSHSQSKRKPPGGEEITPRHCHYYLWVFPRDTPTFPQLSWVDWSISMNISILQTGWLEHSTHDSDGILIQSEYECVCIPSQKKGYSRRYSNLKPFQVKLYKKHKLNCLIYDSCIHLNKKKRNRLKCLFRCFGGWQSKWANVHSKWKSQRRIVEKSQTKCKTIKF